MLSFREVERREAQNHGPVRDGTELDVTLRELAEAGRVRLVESGKRRLIVVNPALLEGQP